MKNENNIFLILKICSFLLVIIAIITNFKIEKVKADGVDYNSSPEMINEDQPLINEDQPLINEDQPLIESSPSNQQSPQTQIRMNAQAGIHRDFPEISNSEFHSLLCYIETEDGRTLNLIEICGQQSNQ